MAGCKIGTGCNIGQNVVISPQVILGNNVKIQYNVSVYTGVVCEDDVFLGPSMVFTNVINPRSHVNRKNEYKTTLIKKGASVGANATIICGHTIGEYAMIGAGSVVTKDVRPFSIMVGNPAKHMGWACKCGEKLSFEDKRAKCPSCGSEYIENTSSNIQEI
jgi:UDP-2-acetamido-3-amino-2,3-dideoxy-glucuronate N-acetyltransferase